jgi:hypothetical protein
MHGSEHYRNGRLRSAGTKDEIFRRVLPQTAATPLYAEVREEKGERWIEDVYIQAQSFWHSIERDTLAQFFIYG